MKAAAMNLRQLPVYYRRMPYRNPVKRASGAIYCAWVFTRQGVWA